MREEGEILGRVEAIHVAEGEGAPMRPLRLVRAVAGRGLEGDRYALDTGHYSERPSPGGGRPTTLIEAEALESLADQAGTTLTAAESRRNLTTRGVRLNDLVGKRFFVGEALCEGVRLCEPRRYLEDLTGKPVLRPLAHRGGGEYGRPPTPHREPQQGRDEEGHGRSFSAHSEASRLACRSRA